MNFKRTIAGIAALSIVGTACFTAGLIASPAVINAATKFGDINGDGYIDASDASLILGYYAYLSTASGEKMSLEQFVNNGGEAPAPQTTTAVPQTTTPSTTTTPQKGSIDPTVKTGGDTLTIAAWNADDVPALIAQWKGMDYYDAREALYDNKIEGINFINFDSAGGMASEKYDQLFLAGDDLDVYFCEADWALKYINDDSRTLPLSKLGFTDDDFKNIYGYTDEIGKDSNGVRKGAAWQAAPGGFAYRADLAEEYLEVRSPEEMQEKVSNWDQFVESAKTIADKSGGKTALADSLGGVWQAYSCARTTPWVENNTLQIDDSCKDFADIAKELWDCGGVTKNGQWTDEWTAAGTTGDCMGYFVSTWGFGGFFLNAAGGVGGDTYGKWAVCEGPSPYFWGGTWIVVNPKTDNGEEARDFIYSAVCDEDNMTQYAINKPEFVNNSKVMDNILSTDTVFNSDVSGNLVNKQNYMKELAENAKNINNRGLITPYDSTIKYTFIDTIQDFYLEEGMSYDETIEVFKDMVNANIPTLTVK